MKTSKEVATSRAGTVEVACDDPQGWDFGASASVEDGRDVVAVRLSRADDAPPPAFEVRFRVSGAGIQNVWSGNHAASGDGRHYLGALWWNWLVKQESSIAHDIPLLAGFNSAGVSPLAFACSEAFERLEFGLACEERTCDAIGRVRFFATPGTPRRAYEAKVAIDRRGRAWHETVRSLADWISRTRGLDEARVPEAAFAPLYSTWYAFLQDVRAEELEAEARLAAGIGMKTMILDDGWQKEESMGFYTATGDWMPARGRFPDMKAHVAAVHAAGLKFMLWLSVPYMGCEAANYPRFRKMLLRDGDTAVLDLRFPEVREYLASTYERVVGEWGFDGLKLDFIDEFVAVKDDPAPAEGFAGRDIRSVPEAIDRLLKDVRARLEKIRPDVLIEFRQSYDGPAIRQYGNMMRAADCPGDPTANRRRICDLRLTSGKMSVHSDMLVWSPEETPEGAALPILNALFATIQYSMVLAKLSPEHRRVISAWLRFSQEHREALLKGAFWPHHPELGYPWIEGESADERVVAVYADDVCAKAGLLDRTVFLVNATGKAGLLAELPSAPAKVEIFDVFGEKTGETAASGLVRLPVPASGYARLTVNR